MNKAGSRTIFSTASPSRKYCLTLFDKCSLILYNASRTYLTLVLLLLIAAAYIDDYLDS